MQTLQYYGPSLQNTHAKKNPKNKNIEKIASHMLVSQWLTS